MRPSGNLSHEPAPMVSLAVHRARKRRAAKADACRRALIALLLLAAGVLSGHALRREQELLLLERVHHLP